MENSYSHSHHQFLKPFIPADDHRIQFELYTIPATAGKSPFSLLSTNPNPNSSFLIYLSFSGWFSWDNIHEIEKTSIKEFFDNSSFTRNPRVYKEYRDFIISKFREDPSRRLTFSEVRKSLVGDVSYLLKVFSFLEKYGLINFGINSSGGDLDREDKKWKVKVEDGPPHGVRVVAIPNSLKPVSIPVGSGSVSCNNGSRLVESDFKMPPLSSHSDVYQHLIELFCENCKERCESAHYECTKVFLISCTYDVLICVFCHIFDSITEICLFVFTVIHRVLVDHICCFFSDFSHFYYRSRLS